MNTNRKLNNMIIPPQIKQHSSYKTEKNNYNEDEEEDPEWGDDDVTDFKKSKVSFREIPTELKESAEQHLLNVIPTIGTTNKQKEEKKQTPDIKFEQKEQIFINNEEEGSNLFEQIESYLLQAEEKEKKQINNLSEQKELQQPHVQVFSSDDFFDQLTSSSQSTFNLNTKNNQFPSSLINNSQQSNIHLSQEYQKKKKQFIQNQEQQQLSLNTRYVQLNNMRSPLMNVNMNFNNNTPSFNQFPYNTINNSSNYQQFHSQQQTPSLHQMQHLPQMTQPQTPQQLQVLYQLQQNQLHQLYINQQRLLQQQHQYQLNQLLHQSQLMSNNSQGNNIRSHLINMNINVPQTNYDKHQVYVDSDEDDDPLMNDFKTDYTKYNPTVFLENPALIVKKNLIEANWFLMKDNKIVGNYNSEELLFFLGEKIKDGEQFENVWISDYHTDLVFQPKNLYDILKEKVPSLKKNYMKSKMGLNKKTKEI